MGPSRSRKAVSRSAGTHKPALPAWPALALGVGLIVVLWAAIGLAGITPTPRDYGVLPPQLATTRAAATELPTVKTARATPPPLARADVDPTAGDDSLPSPPASLSLPSLGVQAAVEPVRATDGVLGVPEDPSRVGWWIDGALAGAPDGAMVIDGHVDSAATGPGALFRLSELRAGDPVVITTTDKRQLRYTVAARRVLSKDSPLPADLFATTGPAQLVLITCGGPFDRQSRSYQDNIAVIATP